MSAFPSPDPLRQFNELPTEAARAALRECCGSGRWAAAVEAQRPFASRSALLECAETVWWGLDPSDWLEAFRSHPRIGERAAEAGQTRREQDWSAREQAGMDAAVPDVRAAMEVRNREYEARFGHIFIVCAAGRSADEMLRTVEQRLGNDPAQELRVAAAEQARITRLRLEALLGGSGAAALEQAH